MKEGRDGCFLTGFGLAAATDATGCSAKASGVVKAEWTGVEDDTFIALEKKSTALASTFTVGAGGLRLAAVGAGAPSREAETEVWAATKNGSILLPDASSAANGSPAAAGRRGAAAAGAVRLGAAAGGGGARLTGRRCGCAGAAKAAAAKKSCEDITSSSGSTSPSWYSSS